MALSSENRAWLAKLADPDAKCISSGGWLEGAIRYYLGGEVADWAIPLYEEAFPLMLEVLDEDD